MKVIYDDERGEVEYDNMDQVILENLINKRLDFMRVSQLYTKHLETLEYLHTKQISEADMPLMQVIQPMQHLKGKPTIDAIYRYLVKYERFKGAPVWDDLIKYVENNNINIHGNYFCDLYKEDTNENV